ncbi:MAG: NADH-quinone oxidoreductase subunit NuoG [Sulfuricella sp.]|nr:NADH-quinone oxidoreductase subunit NuoG [Sulfuricella sp.]
MVTIHIDNQSYQVEAGANLLQACLSLGLDLPYFCWHPALGAVGACRQCAVKQFKDENDSRGRIVMACLTPAQEGLRISIADPEAHAFRAGVIEFLMENHPHDCPVCDEGGECHLQDMTVMTGHVHRRYRFAKRTFRNQYLGPFLNHEMNRCITCYRCVRFYRDYAGGRDLNAMASHNHVYFGRIEDGVLENEFSGNLAEVCPTGVFTDKTFKAHYTRKWDLQTAPSICVHCGVGCNTLPGERYGTLRRIQNRYHHEVNGYFLCDRGRYGHGFVNSEKRLRQPLLRTEGSETVAPVSPTEALAHLAALCAGPTVIGIGSPRASVEANFALQKLVGPERFFNGMSASDAGLTRLILDILTRRPVRSPSLHDMEQADAVLVLGEDVTNTAPRIALSLRQAVRRAALEIAGARHVPLWHDGAVRDAAQSAKSPLFVATHSATRLDDVAAETWHAAPDDLARLGFAVAHVLNPDAPEVPGLDAETAALAGRIALSLSAAGRPLVVSGTGCGSPAVIRAAANVAMALGRTGQPAELCLVAPECNSFGAALLGGEGIDAALLALERGEAETAIVLENDLYRRADRAAIDRALQAAKHLVVIDHLGHATAAQAELVLPAATFAESSGTLVSSEGRAQRFFKVFAGNGEARESWRWLEEAQRAAGRGNGFDGLDDVIAACAAAHPKLQGIAHAAPSAKFRLLGEKIPRQPHRYSGRTAMLGGINPDWSVAILPLPHTTPHGLQPVADRSPLGRAGEGRGEGVPLIDTSAKGNVPHPNPSPARGRGANERPQINIHEQKPPNDPDTPLAFSMEGYGGAAPAALIPVYWAPSWNSVQALNRFQDEVGGPLRGGDPGVRLIEPGADWIWFSEIPAAFQRRADEWLIVPLYHIFGSEELSPQAPAVAERCPRPYLAMNPADADALGLKAGDQADLRLPEGALRLPVELRGDIAPGMAGLPAGLEGTAGIGLPGWGKIDRETRP